MASSAGNIEGEGGGYEGAQEESCYALPTSASMPTLAFDYDSNLSLPNMKPVADLFTEYESFGDPEFEDLKLDRGMNDSPSLFQIGE